jgi:hypothetical protein
MAQKEVGEQLLYYLLIEILKDGVVEEHEKQILHNLFPYFKVSRERFAEIKSEAQAARKADKSLGSVDKEKFLMDCWGALILHYDFDEAKQVVKKLGNLLELDETIIDTILMAFNNPEPQPENEQTETNDMPIAGMGRSSIPKVSIPTKKAVLTTDWEVQPRKLGFLNNLLLYINCGGAYSLVGLLAVFTIFFTSTYNFYGLAAFILMCLCGLTALVFFIFTLFRWKSLRWLMVNGDVAVATITDADATEMLSIDMFVRLLLNVFRNPRGYGRRRHYRPRNLITEGENKEICERVQDTARAALDDGLFSSFKEFFGNPHKTTFSYRAGEERKMSWSVNVTTLKINPVSKDQYLLLYDPKNPLTKVLVVEDNPICLVLKDAGCYHQADLIHFIYPTLKCFLVWVFLVFVVGGMFQSAMG